MSEYYRVRLDSSIGSWQHLHKYLPSHIRFGRYSVSHFFGRDLLCFQNMVPTYYYTFQFTMVYV